MKIIFLDIDGVLNYQYTEERIQGFMGISRSLLSTLKSLVERSNKEEDTKIVLTSSWRMGVNRNGDKISQHYKYLLDCFSDYSLELFDDTPRIKGQYTRRHRGMEIIAWINSHLDMDISGIVILDDEVFPDFETYMLTPYLVQTSLDGTDEGLQESHVVKALEILKKDCSQVINNAKNMRFKDGIEVSKPEVIMYNWKVRIVLDDYSLSGTAISHPRLGRDQYIYYTSRLIHAQLNGFDLIF